MKLAITLSIVLILIVLSGIAYSQTGLVCEDTDPVGDGWGWNGSSSCRTTTNDTCVDTYPLGNGWGWDGLSSCRTTTTAAVTNCIDTDPVGDGWGWDGSSSCRVTSDDSTAEDNTAMTICEDTGLLGDGWGWNGLSSCRVADNEDLGTNEGCMDVGIIGDGWGWNGESSCVVVQSGDVDADGDLVLDVSDNCPAIKNETQHDYDGDGIGDKCDEMTWDFIVTTTLSCKHQSTYTDRGPGGTEELGRTPANDFIDGFGEASTFPNYLGVVNSDRCDGCVTFSQDQGVLNYSDGGYQATSDASFILNQSGKVEYERSFSAVYDFSRTRYECEFVYADRD